MQAAKAAPSREHSKAEPVSLELKWNEALVLVVVAGGAVVMVVCGAAVSTVIVRLAGLVSVLPAASVARTSNVCAPPENAPVVCGEVQAAKAAASTRHWKPAPASLENPKVGVESLVSPVGPESIVVCGAAVSTANARLAAPPVLPAASVARTSNVCAPSDNAPVVCGEVQAAKAAASTRHWKLAPASLEKPNVGVESPVRPVGPESIVVCGAAVSTVKARLAAAPVLPAASVARTSNVCAPSDNAPVVCGDVQAAKAAASTRHWKLAPASLENPNVGVESPVKPVGPESIVVCGATLSTVQV